MSKGKKILIFSLITIVLVTATIIYVNEQFKPLAEDKRNISSSQLKMIVDIEDNIDRNPIIRTYTSEEYDSFNEMELKEIREVVSGNIEGDIPALIIGNKKASFKFQFKKDDHRIEADSLPRVKIFPLDSIYSHRDYRTEDLLMVEDVLIEDEEDMTYRYEVGRQLNNQYIYKDGDDQLLVEAIFIVIEFTIEGNGYISIFAVNVFERI